MCVLSGGVRWHRGVCGNGICLGTLGVDLVVVSICGNIHWNWKCACLNLEDVGVLGVR